MTNNQLRNLEIQLSRCHQLPLHEIAAQPICYCDDEPFVTGNDNTITTTDDQNEGCLLSPPPPEYYESVNNNSMTDSPQNLLPPDYSTTATITTTAAYLNNNVNTELQPQYQPHRDQRPYIVFIRTESPPPPAYEDAVDDQNQSNVAIRARDDDDDDDLEANDLMRERAENIFKFMIAFFWIIVVVFIFTAMCLTTS